MKSFILTWWEWEELREHLYDRDDLWVEIEGEETLFGRFDEVGDVDLEALGFTIQVLPDRRIGRHKAYELVFTPILWLPERVEISSHELINNWCGYPVRMQMEQELAKNWPRCDLIGGVKLQWSAMAADAGHLFLVGDLPNEDAR